MAGIALLLGRSFALSITNAWGDLACILAGLFYTVYLVAIDRSSGGLPPITTLLVSASSGAPLLLAAAWAMGEPVCPHAWTALILLALGSQIIGQGLILYSVARVPPIVVGLMLLVQPIVSATIGWLAYGELVIALDALGAAAIIAAVALVRDSRRTPALPEAEPRPSAAA